MADRPTHIPYIRSSSLIGLKALAGDDELIVQSLLRAARLSPKALDDPDGVIPFMNYSRLMEVAAIELDRPSIGWDWVDVTAPDFANLGPIVFLRRFADTLDDWLNLGLGYWHYHSNACTWHILDDADLSCFKLRLVFHPYARSTRHIAETAIANICVLGREGANAPDDNAVAVRFQHRRPLSTQPQEALFRCPIEFNARYDEIVIDRKYLGYKIVGDLSWFRGLLDAYMKVRIARMKRTSQSVETSVALSIASIIGTNNCAVDETARLLGVSPKKLQRLLADEGTSFSRILDKSRERIARRLMLQSEMPAANVAGLLDYSSPAAFILAFKRWTGETPLAYRNTHRENGTSLDPAEFFLDV